MKAVTRLDIQDKPGYFIMNMTNINNFDPELLTMDDFAVFRDGSILYDIVCCEKNISPYIVFNNIECIFRKSGVFSYLIFCESDKNKKKLDKYIQIIDKIKEEILFLNIDKDENGDDLLVMGRDFMRFKFKTDHNLPYKKN